MSQIRKDSIKKVGDASEKETGKRTVNHKDLLETLKQRFPEVNWIVLVTNVPYPLGTLRGFGEVIAIDGMSPDGGKNWNILHNSRSSGLSANYQSLIDLKNGARPEARGFGLPLKRTISAAQRSAVRTELFLRQEEMRKGLRREHHDSTRLLLGWLGKWLDLD